MVKEEAESKEGTATTTGSSSSSSNSQPAQFVEGQIGSSNAADFKPGQKFPTPSPGNGGASIIHLNVKAAAEAAAADLNNNVYEWVRYVGVVNSDRVFYETLLQQRPDSEMAQEWCLAYGILEWSEAQKLHIKVCKRKGENISLHTRVVSHFCSCCYCCCCYCCYHCSFILCAFSEHDDDDFDLSIVFAFVACCF